MLLKKIVVITIIIVGIMYLLINKNRNDEAIGSGNYTNDNLIVHNKGTDYFAVGNKIYSIKNNILMCFFHSNN